MLGICLWTIRGVASTVAHLPLGYRTAGKEIAAISTKAHKQSLRMRAENPYEIGLPASMKPSSSPKTNKVNSADDKLKTNNEKSATPLRVVAKSRHHRRLQTLAIRKLPRVDLQTYSHEDVGFQIKIYFIVPEEIESENIKMEFLEQAFEIWAVSRLKSGVQSILTETV